MRIYGASDDLVELDGVKLDERQRKGTTGGGRDEIGCYGHDVVIILGSAEGGPGTNGAGVLVKMAYGVGKTGVWQAAIRPLDEDVPCPWEIQVGCEGYSAVVDINAPVGVPIRINKVRRKS